MDQDGTIHSEDFDKANVLNDFFCKQTMLNDGNVSLPELPLFDGVGLSNIFVTSDGVESVLKALPIGKATDPGGINNCVLRELAHELSSPLFSLFNQSLSVGIVPDIWKEAHMCPIPKGGDKKAVSNYRPISLLSNINKVLERIIVFKHLYYTCVHFLENDILTPLQSGFIPGVFLVSSWCLVMVEWLLLAVPWGWLRFVIVVFSDHTHYFWLRINVMRKFKYLLNRKSLETILYPSSDQYSNKEMLFGMIVPGKKNRI